MSRHTPPFLRAASAAAVLDTALREFRMLVQTTALPALLVLSDDIKRWAVAGLRAILRAQRMRG